MKFKFLSLIFSFLLLAPLGAQAQSNIASALRSVSSLPMTCTVGEVRYKTGSGAGVYVCSATNTWSAVGSGGGVTLSPTQIPYADSMGMLVGSNDFVKNTTDDDGLQDFSYVQSRPNADDTAFGMYSNFASITAYIEGTNTSDSAGSVWGLEALAENRSGHAISDVEGLFAEGTIVASGSTADSVSGGSLLAYNRAGALVTDVHGVNAWARTINHSTTTNQFGAWSVNQVNASTVTLNSNFYAGTLAVVSGGTATTNVAFYTESQAGTGINNYAFWAGCKDSTSSVRRIKAEDDGNYTDAWYEQGFTCYTPGAADYSRLSIGNFDGTAHEFEIKTEAAGMGTLRGLSLTAAKFNLHGVSSGATGKHVLCIDGTTKEIYESSTGTDCSN